MSEFDAQVKIYSQTHFNLTIPAAVSSYAASLFDAVLLFAHAATRVLASGGNVRDGTALVKAMTNISFEGIQQRRVELDANGDAIEPYSIMSYLEQADGEMGGVEVGQYASRKLKLRVADVRWPGNTTRVPADTAGVRPSKPCLQFGPRYCGEVRQNMTLHCVCSRHLHHSGCPATAQR